MSVESGETGERVTHIIDKSVGTQPEILYFKAFFLTRKNSAFSNIFKITHGEIIFFLNKWGPESVPQSKPPWRRPSEFQLHPFLIRRQCYGRRKECFEPPSWMEGTWRQPNVAFDCSRAGGGGGGGGGCGVGVGVGQGHRHCLPTPRQAMPGYADAGVMVVTQQMLALCLWRRISDW